MGAENRSSSLVLDPLWSGGHWGTLSTTDLVAFETEALARALGASMLPNPEASSSAVVDTTTLTSSSMSSTFFSCSPSPTVSNVSTFTAGAATAASSSAGSHPYFPRSASASPRPTPIPPSSSRPQPGAVVADGRITKRKPRRSPPSSSSKRSPIQFIETDPASFREMVQQMTGIGMPQALLPAPMGMMHMGGPPQMSQRSVAQVQPPVLTMPTLDTSAGFVVDTVSVPHQQQQQILSAPRVFDDSFSFFLPEFDCADELLMAIPEFPQYQQQQPQPNPLPPCFPTLESWSD